jgi:WD40 repeat protein
MVLVLCCWHCAGKVAVFGVDGQQRMEWKALHSSMVNDVDWAHADRCASASDGKTCKVWDPQTGELTRVSAAVLRLCRI